MSASPLAWRALCVAACVATLASRASAAAPEWIELSWQATDDCSSAADVLRAVDAQLGEQFVSQTRIQARGHLQQQEAGAYDLQLEYTTAAGARDQRRIHGESCQAVSEAAALVLALALDPTHATPPSAASDAGEKLEFLPGVVLLLDTAVMSLPTAGLGVRFGLRYGAFELNASAQWFVPREPAAGDISMHLSFWSVNIGACYLAPVASWSIGPCAHFELGRLTGTPHGDLETSSPGSEWVHLATFAAAARVPIFGAFHLGLDAGLEWVARRPQFQVTGAGTASPEPFGARIVAGPFLAF